MRASWLKVLLLLAMLVAALPAGAAGAAVQAIDTAGSPQRQQPAPGSTGPSLTGPVVSAPVAPGRNEDLPAISAADPLAPVPTQQTERPFGRLLFHAGAAQAAPAGDAAVDSTNYPNSMPAPIVNFEGVYNMDGVYPPDTDGSVGPNHYVQMVNLHTAVYDKSGTPLYGGAFTPNLLWPTGDACRNSNDGDPVVLYDRFADRWLLSQFALPNYPSGPFYECFAISKTPVPTNVPADWWVYTFLVHQTKMDDYPKIAIWPDGYYMTVNQFYGGSNGNAGVFVFDRAKMLLGQTATFQYFDLTPLGVYGGQLPVDLEGSTPPPAGTPAFFLEIDDSSWIPPVDAMRIWKFHVDWTTPANSYFGDATHQPNFTLPVQDFNILPCTASGSRSCIPQQGTSVKLDAIGDRLMFRATYRNFGDHSSILVNHTVKADGADRAGVRWYEIRNAETSPTIYQQGTAAPADGNYRWMASMTMDQVGNIALGYSVSGSAMYPSIRYTGRLATDPLGEMPQGETTVINGSGAQTGTGSRWGDYSAMSIDPTDDCTFWYTQEYIQTTGGATWQTRVASFKFPSCAAVPTGTLAGTVTRTDTNQPIGQATVAAWSGGAKVSSTTTNGSGAYSMQLPTGVYSVTATALHFLPKTIEGVTILENQTTNLPIGLDHAPSFTVSGKVYDPAAGWPLYAQVTVNTDPPQSIWTDPVTGAYSLLLESGYSYTLQARPFAQGYLPAAVNTGVVSGNLALDIPVQPDTLACNAPGYKLDITGLSETFNGAAFPPAGWTVTKSATSCGQWSGSDPGHRGNLTGGGGTFAIADVDFCGTGGKMDTTLTSPVVDVSSLPSVGFSFAYDYFNLFSNESADVDVSRDGGATWTNALHWNSSHRGPGVYSGDVTSLLGGSTQAQIRFHYVAPDFDYWWQVDNALLGRRSCYPQAGGMVVGRVLDPANVPLVGATVANDAGGSTTTLASVDPALGSFYTLFTPAGSHQLTASMAPYPPASAWVTVPVSNTVRQDFTLTSGRLTYAPASIDKALLSGDSTTVPVQITNVGANAATFSISELAAANLPAGPVDQPPYVVKPFRQHMADASEGFGETIGALPAFDGGTVLESWAPKLSVPWGLVFDGRTSKVLVANPESWGGDGRVHEYGAGGAATGREWTLGWNPENGPADAAYNWNTGNVWLVDVPGAGAGCIYELGPANGPTGRKICPEGITVSQRGLAYDPSTNTFFAGSWNDQMIYRFAADGTLLGAKNVGINVAGLAYNPDTGHLFVINNANAEKVYVLDANANYAGVGEFAVPAMAPYGGAGLELGCSGDLWAADQAGRMVYRLSTGEASSVCAADVPWLTEAPTTGTVQPGQSVTLNVTLNSAGMAAGVYHAGLMFSTNTSFVLPDMPVTMTVGVAPQCDFTSDSPTLLGQPTHFTNASTNATNYSWDFGDGSPVSTEVNPAHTYATIGVYNVHLAASSPFGQASHTASVSVEAQPVPSFTSNSPARFAQAVVFTNTTPDANPAVTGWEWDFGDGATSTDANPTHTYATPGDYTVVLKATNSRGTAIFTATVSVWRTIFLPSVTR